MLMGIDVGGTFTDGVLYRAGKIVKSVKKPTEEDNLKNSLLQVLDELLAAEDKEQIQRIVLSTTLVTNSLATGRGEKTAMVLLPGYGLPHDSYELKGDTHFMKGAVDFRGREIEPLDKEEIRDLLDWIKDSGVKRIALAAKFANRNNVHELMLKKRIGEECDGVHVSISSEISGKLNFPRRAATTYFTAMTISEWNRFADQIEAALEHRGIKAEVHVLKADGGTMPLTASRTKPCETVFSGPAASTMGGSALTRDKLNSVVVDVGGTTTDLSLIIAGEPLYASKGAVIENQLTHVNSFAVRSIPLGGDSVITIQGVQSYRLGPAACFGGEQATVTDAFNIHLNLNLGEVSQSQSKLHAIAQELQLDTASLSARIVEEVSQRLLAEVNDMFRQWENEPAYKVWEVINQRKFTLDRVIGIGAAAPALVPALSGLMQVESFIHEYSPVANALGAAVVRPTLSVILHVDTQTKKYTLDPGGIIGTLEKTNNFQMDHARAMARQHLHTIGQELGMEDYTAEADFFLEEQFNMIRGWDRTGKLFEVGIQVSPGFVNEYEGVTI
ncbi:MAG: hydantoinase/oxoprolinase family protein [Syntrophomonadaceae bacterium]|nr:hydantoinase/oxoprolinase family protein [Syntrophomonadaceae bacterium]